MNDLGVGPLADPTGARAANLLVKYAAPASVLDTGSPNDIFDAGKFPANFADLGMTYPIHTPAAAWVSAAAYHDSGAGDKVAGERIKRAMVYHRLPGGEWERLEKAAAPDPYTATRFALPEVGKYPLDTPEQVKTASAYFEKWADRFDPEVRRAFAANLAVAGSNVLATEKVARLEAEAGWARPANDWRHQFQLRAAMAPTGSGLPQALEKTAAAVEASGFPEGQFRTAGELAELLRSVDRKMGWNLPDPLHGLTADTPSTARAKLARVVEAATGDFYQPEAVDGLDDEAFAGLFGGGLVVTRAEKLAALKDPQRGPLLTAVLAGQGIFPEGRAPAKTDWAAIAAGS